MRIGKHTLRLQTTISLMICSVLAVVLLVVYIMLGLKVATQTKDSLEQQAVMLARTISRTPLVIESLEDTRNTAELQSYAEEMQKINAVQFVVVIDMNGIRYTHPDLDKIGEHFTGGDEQAVLEGRESISEAKGSLGSSVRAFSPVRATDGTQVGAVSVGISLSSVQTAVQENEGILYWGILIGCAMGAAGALLLARKIKRIMFGMEPSAIAKLLEERSAMLQSVREGIIAVDQHSRITLVNAEARRLLADTGMQGEPLSQSIADIWPSLRMETVLESGEASQDLEVELGGITLLMNVLPVRVSGKVEGAIATFRDKTEISLLLERLSGISLYAEALRAQAHEFMNKLHVILGLTHMRRYDRLEEYITGTVSKVQEEVGMMVRQVRDPVMAGFLLGKLSRAREAGIRLVVLEDGILPEAGDPEVSRELITIVGNLLDNAMEAPEGVAGKRIHIGFQYKEGGLIITVSDNGRGMPKGVQPHIFSQGYSTKGKDRGSGLYLVERSLLKTGGTIICETGEGEGTRFTVKLPYQVKGDSL
ncbi:DcuS/MalK family sensor histidine kinase [Paenibacillus donghaensis]|uniref:histidine kinase n=1 Tax=Paenibacillus donghaensis TaxID=414771 RepID=A0A2Z2KFF1_9BACL|nr:DcuS/MalK family sensor histidine kinase [Paenibacillus donghaensis]ASA20829.1 two-component system sensor histidine kinase DcuS [Paenibacillus donghaensis]